MYVDSRNVNYGYSVGTHGKYVAIGNPMLLRYDPLTASLYQSGSVDVYRYDINTDQHFYVNTLHKPIYLSELILLAAESASILSSSLHTETEGYDFANRDKDILVDVGMYFTAFDDDYGYAVDCYDKKIAVGCRYYLDKAVFSSSTFTFTGSAVDIWDYTYSERNIYTYNTLVSVLGYGFTGSGAPSITVGDTASVDLGTVDLTIYNYYYEVILVPPGYDELWVSMTTTASGSLGVVSKIPVSPDGEIATYAMTASLQPGATASYLAVITNEIRHFSIENPDVEFSESFGHVVSMNDHWLAIGSPLVSSSKGLVYLYENKSTGSNLSWSLYQTLAPSDLYEGQLYGWDLAMNKSTGSCKDRLIVGAGSADNPYVYLYELSESVWVETHRFEEDTSVLYPLTFNTSSYPILLSSSYQTSSFGWAVGIWEDTVVIGAPTERQIFEYTGSAFFEQGTAYIFERCPQSGCPVTESLYKLQKKIYGDLYTLKNNRLGYSVSVFGENMVIGIPKIDVGDLTACFEQVAIPQQLYCNADLQDTVHGQWMYLTRNTSSLIWENQKVFQRRKRFLSPYRCLGKDVSMGNLSVVIGAPIWMAERAREISLIFTESLGTSLDDVMGKAYIYNLHNYKPEHYVGNAFYRNGTLVVNTSGSAFEGLYFNPTTPYTYEYLLRFKSRHQITEKQVVCTVEPGEFNVSTNPTAIDKATSPFDLNQNGVFDFQDADVLLRYMQYKNSTTLGGYSFDWSSSVVKEPDEISFYNYNAEQWTNTDFLFSSSLKRFETVDLAYANLLDFNQDNKIDINDMFIMWKYFSNRLSERNYLSYINSNCQRQQVSQAIIYIDDISKRHATPMIVDGFFDYDRLSAADRTGSFLAPMVTTIGLYDGLDLVAVAKVGAPIKLPKTLPINFVVKVDF